MCGRFLMVSEEDLDDIVAAINRNPAVNVLPDWPAVPQHPISVSPGDMVPLLAPNAADALTRVNLTWGFDAPWKQGVVFNTRVETADNPRGSFWRDALAQRRCIIPTWGFFETHRSEQTLSPRSGKPVKRPYLFTGDDQSPLFLAGIHDEGRFSLMTTEPCPAVAPIHNRMPLVLEPGELPTWLSEDYRALFDRSRIALQARACGQLTDAATRSRIAPPDGQTSLF